MSGTVVVKHEGVVPAWPENAAVMSIPPSKKSGDTIVLPTPSVVRGQPLGGDGVVPRQRARRHLRPTPRWWAKALVVAQSESPAPVILQSAPVAIGRLLQPCAVDVRVRVVVRVDAAAVTGELRIRRPAERLGGAHAAAGRVLRYHQRVAVLVAPGEVDGPLGDVQFARPCRNQTPTSLVPLLTFLSTPK